jgi:hypothetical protein
LGGSVEAPRRSSMWNGRLQLGHMNHTTPSVVPSGVGGDAAHRGQAIFRARLIP